jgi:manganese oxidase
MPEEHRETHAGMAHTDTQSPNEHEDHAATGHAVMGHDMHDMKPNVTRPQLAVVGLLTVLALVASVLVPAMFVNLTYSAEEVGGAVMPPGMVMSRDTPAAAMREMSAVDPGEVSYDAPAGARGDSALEPRIEGGVKVFDLDVSVIEWNILPDQSVEAYAFNRQVPGPRIRVTEGDRVRINVKNDLPEATSVHWHGMILPNGMDGAADVTQDPIEPGESFAYEFTAKEAGTYFYHSHKEPDRQQGLGMYGALIVDPRDPGRDAAYDYDEEIVVQLQEWLERDGYTYPAMTMEGALPNYFTINGKSYPETETVNMEVGERLRIRFIGSNNNFVHPMHVHGGPFEIVETDGNVVPEGARLLKDTVNVGPGERYDVVWEAREPGKWLIHCHIPHHTTNDNTEQEGGGGLMAVINVTD